MGKLIRRLPLLAALLLASAGFAAQPAPSASSPALPFFAFDNGVGRGRWAPEQQAATLARLGYEGIGYSGLEDLTERLAAFDKHGLRIFNLYVGARFGPEGATYDQRLKEALPLLRGRNIALWLHVNGKAEGGKHFRDLVIRKPSPVVNAGVSEEPKSWCVRLMGRMQGNAMVWACLSRIRLNALGCGIRQRRRGCG